MRNPKFGFKHPVKANNQRAKVVGIKLSCAGFKPTFSYDVVLADGQEISDILESDLEDW